MDRMKIVVSQGGGERQIEMALEEGLKIAFGKSNLYGDDKEKERDLIKEISTCLDEFRNKNGSLVLLEVEECEKPLIKIMIE